MKTLLTIGAALALATTGCTQTREDGVAAAYGALRDGDSEAFCKCLSRKIAAQHCHDDRRFAMWREAALNYSLEQFSVKVKMLKENGRWKVDEQ